jgi:two-component system, NtrC family, nitrogen regulation sensor histidine kinase NtrY
VLRLRSRLILAFLAATVLPLAATIWITTSLLERSLGYATTGEIDRLSRSFESTVRQFYQAERERLRQDAASGTVAAVRYVRTADAMPDPVRAFLESGEAERFGLSGPGGDHVTYLRRTSDGADLFTRDLRGVRMEQLSSELRETRRVVDAFDGRDLRRGFTLTLLLLVAIVWVISLAPLVFIADRVSRPMQQLTAGLTDFAGGDWSRRVPKASGDEVGTAVDAFNHMAEQLQRSRDRLVHLTQMASWQSLARKTAHELKNSLTPIRLTIEEMLARQPPSADRVFMDQAVQIVVSEIDTLERLVRAFSELASEPPVTSQTVDINALARERTALLKPAHPQTTYTFTLDERKPQAHADVDLVKGIITNLLQNAAEAAGPQGTVLIVTRSEDAGVAIEVHDSGPGLDAEARTTLFEPTITFKSQGMGLGLSIAKKNARLCGGDIVPIDGALGGAAFKVTLPVAHA